MNLRPVPRALATAAAAVTLSLTAACGGGDDDGSGSRPTAGEIADAIADNDAGLSDDAIDCSAEALESSDVSDEGLQSIIDDAGAGATSPPDLSAEDTRAFGAATSAILACAGDDLEDQLGDLPTDLGDLPTDLPSDFPTDFPTG